MRYLIVLREYYLPNYTLYGCFMDYSMRKSALLKIFNTHIKTAHVRVRIVRGVVAVKRPQAALRAVVITATEFKNGTN